jgi:hypothetical protein
MKPTVLVATTTRWFPTAWLAMALAKAGFAVKAVCPTGHPLGKTGAAQEIYTYHGLAPIVSFSLAIAAAKPDIIIPGDDLATQHLHEVCLQKNRTGKAGERVPALIERSLCSPESFAVVQARTRAIEVAREEGVRVPRTEVIANLEDLGNWVARMGLPAVLKADGSSGGDGVRIVHTTEQAECAFRSLSNPPLWARAAKRTLINRDTTLVRPAILRHRPIVNAQAFVPGYEATSTVLCWQGSVLAALHFEVLNKADSTGPATVLRLIEDAEMSAATQKIARRLKLSGMHGFDFIRETRTGNAYLIEINPRTTQVGHLAFGPGRDLPAALYAAVSGEAVHVAEMVTEKDTIALFPQEWIRDSASPYLRSTYHDVPWEAPDLVLACIRSRRRQFAWNSTEEDLRAFRELLAFTYRGSTEGLRRMDWVTKQMKFRYP